MAASRILRLTVNDEAVSRFLHHHLVHFHLLTPMYYCAVILFAALVVWTESFSKIQVTHSGRRIDVAYRHLIEAKERIFRPHSFLNLVSIDG